MNHGWTVCVSKNLTYLTIWCLLFWTFMLLNTKLNKIFRTTLSPSWFSFFTKSKLFYFYLKYLKVSRQTTHYITTMVSPDLWTSFHLQSLTSLRSRNSFVSLALRFSVLQFFPLFFQSRSRKTSETKQNCIIADNNRARERLL